MKPTDDRVKLLKPMLTFLFLNFYYLRYFVIVMGKKWLTEVGGGGYLENLPKVTRALS